MEIPVPQASEDDCSGASVEMLCCDCFDMHAVQVAGQEMNAQ
jgi:hypothetical protein